MSIKAFYYFLFIMLSSNLLRAENSYCYNMCKLGCDNFYKQEGVSSKTDPAAIKLCINSCMDEKCLND